MNDDDLELAAAHYATLLPPRLNLIHLGIGPDGHCASLIPGDPVLDVTDRLVAVSELYQGTQRMTLTYPAIAASEQLLWVISGEDKKEALAKLLDGDPSIRPDASRRRRRSSWTRATHLRNYLQYLPRSIEQEGIK